MTRRSPSAGESPVGVLVLASCACVFAALICGGLAAKHSFAGLYDAPLVGREVPERLGWAFETTRGELRRPLFWLAAQTERALPRDWAQAMHVASAVLHGLGATLAVLLAARVAGATTRGARGLAAAGVLLWMLHPLRVEAVAWASQQGVVLGTTLLVAAALAWWRSMDGNRRAPRAAALLLLAAALLADPTLCGAPIAFFALTRFRRGETGATPSDKRALAAATALGALAFVASFAVRETGGGAPPLAAALATASALVRPLRATLWPVGLHPAYDAPAGFPDVATSLWIDAATAAALVAVAVWGVRRRNGLGLALLACLGLVAGRLALTRDAVGADVDAHAATLPLFLAAGVVLARTGELLGRWARALEFAAVAGAALLGVLVSEDLARGWADEAQLAFAVERSDPVNETALVAQGDSARRDGAPAADLVHWHRRVLEEGDWRPLAHARLGAALLETGDAAGARTHLERAVAIAPWLARARYDLGALDLSEGRLEDAKRELEAAARLDAESPDAHRLLSQALDRLGDGERAASEIVRAAELRPDDAAIAEERKRLTR